jgi:hypothetical protein
MLIQIKCQIYSLKLQKGDNPKQSKEFIKMPYARKVLVLKFYGNLKFWVEMTESDLTGPSADRF